MGKLHGFAGGLKIKAELLKHERSIATPSTLMVRSASERVRLEP
jgi:hypothetical protein